MGIRPQMMLLCGIDNLKVRKGQIVDPRVNLEVFEDRYYRSFDLAQIPESVRFLFSHTKGAQSIPRGIEELVHWDEEFGRGSVLGYVWDRIGSQDTLYALAACYPQFGIETPGRIVLPTTPLEEDISEGSNWLKCIYKLRDSGQAIPREDLHQLLKRSHQKRLLHKFNQNYVSFSSEFEWRAEAALAALQQAGVSLGRRDLKLMLYWQWS